MLGCIITQTNTGAASVLISVLFKNERVSFQQMPVDDLHLYIKKGGKFSTIIWLICVVCSSNFRHLKPVIFRIRFIKVEWAVWACFCVCMGIGSVLERCVCKYACGLCRLTYEICNWNVLFVPKACVQKTYCLSPSLNNLSLGINGVNE